MTVYLNVVTQDGEKNFDFINLSDYWAYFNKYKVLFKYHPTRFDDEDGNIFYLYDHTKGVERLKIKQNAYPFVFKYIDLSGGVKTTGFDDLKSLKQHFMSLKLEKSTSVNNNVDHFSDSKLFDAYYKKLNNEDKLQIEKEGDQYIYTYREDKMYMNFAAQKTASYATYLPVTCNTVRFVWIDNNGDESVKVFESIASFWEFFDSCSLKYEPIEFFDEDNDEMNYIYDLKDLAINGKKSIKHEFYYKNVVSSFGENRDQRVVY